jgi:hypothetical protein
MKKKQKTKPTAKKMAHQYITHFQPITLSVFTYLLDTGSGLTLAIVYETSLEYN